MCGDLEDGGSKADKIQRTINDVTNAMRGNLNRMFENQSELDRMGDKSDNLRRSAETFNNSASRLEKQARQRRQRAYMIICAMILSSCVILYMAIS